jgi:uncharacterized protein
MSIWSETLEHVAHRPYPLPTRTWVMHMSWQELLFAHWPFRAEVMRERIAAACGGWPGGLELDLYEGDAWLSIVPFRMARVGLRFWPTPLGPHTFPELNVRTYVTAKDPHTGQPRPGVFFFSLDAASPLAVFAARRGFHLPYFNARMTVRRKRPGPPPLAPPTPASAPIAAPRPPSCARATAPPAPSAPRSRARSRAG